MSQTLGKEQKLIMQGQHRQNSAIQGYIHDYKINKLENNEENANQHIQTVPQNQNNETALGKHKIKYSNPYISPKYRYEKLPEIQVKQNETENVDDIEKSKHQRSSSTIYKHINEQMNLTNPYLTKPNRSYSQKTVPSAVMLQQIKQERIIVQEQNQMLINRLRKLRQEELQLQKSAEDAAKKAEKIFQQKKFYLKKKEEEQQRIQQQDDVGYTHPKKQLEMLRVQIAKEEIMKKKKEGFYQVKQIIAEEQIRKAQEQKVAIENVKFKMEQMKKQKEISKQRKEQYFQEKKLKLEKELQKQRIKEEAMLSFAKFEAKDFERREQEMLERIRQTQMMQEQAKEQLKESVSLDIFEYENRYVKDKKATNNSHHISMTSLNGKQNKNGSQKGIGTNYNSRSISQQVLKINSHGQSYISNGQE